MSPVFHSTEINLLMKKISPHNSQGMMAFENLTFFL